MLNLEAECPIDKDAKCAWQFQYFTTGNYPNLSIYKCNTCGLESLFPRPNQTELYDENYYKGKSEYTYIDERQTEKYHRYVWEARIKNIKKFVSTGKFLDIGSSFGGFLSVAKANGFEVQGVEVSKYASDYANLAGIPTYAGSLLEAKFPDSNFDVICLIEVIEHLEAPHLIFPELRRILKPGGLLLLQTANFEGWQAKTEGSKYHYYMPGHVFYYSDSILKKILTPLGFNRYISYFGVDFSLLAKMKKAVGSFNRWLDYWKLIRISFYHFKSKFTKSGFPLTSSYVLYAILKK